MWHPRTEICGKDDVPRGGDIGLIGGGQREDMQALWDAYLRDDSGRDVEHPNNYLNVLWCSVDADRKEAIDLELQVNTRDRLHCAVRTLPKPQLMDHVRFPDRDGHPYLVVGQEWFDDLSRSAFSIYGLVDVAGMREYLSRSGALSAKQLLGIRERIDLIAAKNRHCAFISHADSIVVKTNWSAGKEGYESTYQPENFIVLLGELGRVFTSVLGLEAYAVAAQGANQCSDDALLHVSNERNHIFFPSLATPFAQVFEIEKAARSAVKEHRHGKASLYLSKGLLNSLRFGSHSTPATLVKRMVAYSSTTTSSEHAAYLPIDELELRSYLED
jgi:hypothetical protein